jgi:hypothetical protein
VGGGFRQGAEVSEFSAADAAFTGFRIVWERPWAVAIWAALQFVVNLAINVFVAASAGSAMAQIAAMGLQPPNADPAQALALIRQVAPTYMVLLIIWLVVSAVFYAAMNRAVLRPEESRFGYLRLAADELRQLGLFALIFAVLMGAYFAVGLITIVLFLALGVFGGMIVAILLPIVVCAAIFFGVRFSLASPLTFATGRINLAGSWRLTRGRFWPLLGTYLIAVALSLVVLVLIVVIALLAVGILSGGLAGLASVMQGRMNSVADVLTPAQLLYLAITSIGAALSAPITICPPAAIYRALVGGGAAKVFE